MKKYQCHKQVIAKPMIRLEYVEYRGWKLPDDEDGTDDGYLIEYLEGGDSNHPDHENYISWSPKAVFDAGYTEIVDTDCEFCGGIGCYVCVNEEHEASQATRAAEE